MGSTVIDLRVHGIRDQGGEGRGGGRALAVKATLSLLLCRRTKW